MLRRLLLLALAATTGWSGGCTRPCESPIPYRVGAIDPRFRISKNELTMALRRAEEAWEDTAQRNLFRLDDRTGLVVSLIYDDRQQTAQANERRKRAVEKAGDQAGLAKKRYTSAKARVETLRLAFESAVASNDKRIADHNRMVEQWNSRGGAPPDKHQQLLREEAAIETSRKRLEVQRDQLNAQATRVNRLSLLHNELVDEINTNVQAVNETAGQEFKQGRFVRDDKGTRIEVYEYIDREDLVHLLAHEMGHALGLEHNDNPESIMYGVNSSRTALPTEEDMAGLRRICRL